jgi:hypothetical protein
MTGITNNGHRVQKAIAVVLALGVQAAALTAPLLHAHPDDHATGHHSGRSVHTHWDGHDYSQHPSNDPAINADDHDRAVFLNPFVAVAASPLSAVAVAQQPFEIPVPSERPAHRSVHVAHSHDPPVLGSLQPRAPPTLLS